MTLGECIKEYRENKGLSQRQFADMCGLSNAYISILEKNVNPKTGEAPSPTYAVFSKIASAMGIGIQDLTKKANDTDLSVGYNMVLDEELNQYFYNLKRIFDIYDEPQEPQDVREAEINSLFRSMTSEDQDKLLDYARYIVDTYKRNEKGRNA